jgi:hypothetical protein
MSRKNSTAIGIGTALSGAAIAMFIGMGTAHADVLGSETDPFQNTDTGGFSELFGGTGSVQGPNDALADTSLLDSNAGSAGSFSTDVIAFEDGADHPITDLIYALDPSAFQFQDTPGIDAAGESFGGAYLVPDDFLGYLATSLDYFTLNPTGLDYALGPLIDILLGGSFT